MTIKQFQKLVWDFYRYNGRVLPWRKNINPYRILVSEIMLQQTQVSRVIPKYRLFLKLFPNCKSLSQASSAEVLQAWSGLGYNRRGLYLKRAAEMIMEEFSGKFPQNMNELIMLPGVGENTAGAILAYAFNEPVLFIETNIRRVYLHHFFQNQKNVPDSDLMPFIVKSIDQINPREWYWALMDYGSYLSSVVENPNRRSRHYTKQSKFPGSLRQLRGRILKLLLEKQQVLDQLQSRLADDRLPEALEQLVAEGFVSINKNKIRIKK